MRSMKRLQAVEKRFMLELAYILAPAGSSTLTGHGTGYSGVVARAQFKAEQRPPQAGEASGTEVTIATWRIFVPVSTIVDPTAKVLLRGISNYTAAGAYTGDYDAGHSYVKGDCARLAPETFWSALGPVTGVMPGADPTKWMRATAFSIIGNTDEASDPSAIEILCKKL